MKKKLYVLGVAALVAAMLAMSGVAQSAMWVGGELGGNFPLNTDITAKAFHQSATLSGVAIRPSVIGGATLGYDFVNSGFGGRAWPGWMQYFSVATDITYNRVSIYGGQSVGVAVNGVNLGNVLLPNSMRLNGYEVAWAFMFMAHYGFLRDSEIPSGRINPYIGVGPAILFSAVQGATTTNIALAVETGIRWVCLPNVSIDTGVRYRYGQPAWEVNNNVTVKADALHQLAFLVRANYHF